MESQYRYDLFSNRIEKSVDEGSAVITRYAYDGWNPAKPTPIGYENVDIWGVFDVGGSLTSRQLQGDGINERVARVDIGVSPTAYWTLTDERQSVRQVIDNGGTVVDAIVYDAFGQILTETNASLRGLYAHEGSEYDNETHFSYHLWRYYDPALGRWITQDPIKFTAGDVNLYRYVGNNPTNFTDPSGLDHIATNRTGNFFEDILEPELKWIVTENNRAIAETRLGFNGFSRNPELGNNGEAVWVWRSGGNHRDGFWVDMDALNAEMERRWPNVQLSDIPNQVTVGWTDEQRRAEFERLIARYRLAEVAGVVPGDVRNQPEIGIPHQGQKFQPAQANIPPVANEIPEWGNWLPDLGWLRGWLPAQGAPRDEGPWIQARAGGPDFQNLWNFGYAWANGMAFTRDADIDARAQAGREQLGEPLYVTAVTGGAATTVVVGSVAVFAVGSVVVGGVGVAGGGGALGVGGAAAAPALGGGGAALGAGAMFTRAAIAVAPFVPAALNWWQANQHALPAIFNNPGVQQMLPGWNNAQAPANVLQPRPLDPELELRLVQQGRLPGADAPAGQIPLSAARQLELLNSATQATNRSGLSEAGRALQSHSQRPGSWLAGRGAGGNAAQNTAAARTALQEVLAGGQAVRSTHPDWGEIITVRLQDGAGAVWRTDGTFVTFLERYTPR